MTDVSEFEYLNISGEVSVKPFTDSKLPKNARLCLVVGPTGAGKSSFIEAFVGNSQTLSISSDQLEGCTQKVTPYQLINIKWCTDPVLLLNTPGFSDSKISENEILNMTTGWLNDNRKLWVNTIFFLIPINATRLSGSKRRTIEMFRSLVPRGKSTFVFVTTMWDALHNPRARERADSHFLQLKNIILKDFIDDGATITRFNNTKETSLDLLNLPIQYTDAFTSSLSGADQHRHHLYQDLCDRIGAGVQTKKRIEGDLAAHDVQANRELNSILEKDFEENEKTLCKFITEWCSFGRYPVEFQDVTKALYKAVVADSGIIAPELATKDILYIDRGTGADIRQGLRYGILYSDVKRAFWRRHLIEVDLANPTTANDVEAKLLLKRRWVERQAALWRAIARWIRYREPMSVFADVTQNLRKAVIAHSGIGRAESAYEDLFYLWEHHPRWYPGIDELPYESGAFDADTRRRLKDRRRYYERQ